MTKAIGSEDGGMFLLCIEPAPTLLVPILVSSLISNQKESKSLKNTENGICLLG